MFRPIRWDETGSLLFWFGIMRDIITLGCTECKRRNYTTTKNKRKTPNKLEFKKFCRFCRSHTLHKETK